MSKMQRDKGKRWEREVAALMRQAMPGCETIKRGYQSRGAKADKAPDVDCPIYWIECKHGIKPNPRAALAQATSDSEGTGKVPVAVIKDNRRTPFVVLGLTDFLELVRENWELSNAVD